MTKRKGPSTEAARPTLDTGGRSVDPEVERVLRERADRLAERSALETEDQVHVAVIVATRGQTQLGFPVGAIDEARTARVARLPLASRRVAGLIAVRGQVLTLLDPAVDEGNPLDQGATTPVIVVAHEGRVSAVRVDAIVGSRSVTVRELDPRDRERHGSIASAITRDGLEIVDVERLMAFADSKSGGAA